MIKYFRKKNTWNTDLMGSATAILCAIHCSVLPIISSLGILQISKSHNHGFDWIMFAIGLAIALYSIAGDYINKHRNIAPFSIAIFGFILLGIGISSHSHGFPTITLLGGAAIVLSHYINYQISKKYGCSI